MLINYIKYCFRQAVISLSRNRWLALVSAGMIAVSLAILGGFLLAAVNSNQAMQNIQSNLEIVIFLKDGADISNLEKKINQLEGIAGCTFVDKHRGLQEFGRSLGDEALMAELAGENNPLPDIFRVRAREGELVPVLAGQIEQLPGVESVDYGKELVHHHRDLQLALLISVSISSPLAVGGNLSCWNHHPSLGADPATKRSDHGQLGASDWFIRLPFCWMVYHRVDGQSWRRLSPWVWSITSLPPCCCGNASFFLQPVTAPGILVLFLAACCSWEQRWAAWAVFFLSAGS